MVEHATATESERDIENISRDQVEEPAEAGELAAATDVSEPLAAEPPFGAQELAQFDTDDVQAGRAIGQMLSLFFLYTIIVMSIVAWWTISAIGN